MRWIVHWLLAVVAWARLEALPSVPSHQLLSNGDIYFSYYYQPPLSSYYHTVHESVLNEVDPHTYSEGDNSIQHTEAPSPAEAQTYSYGQGVSFGEEDFYDGATSYYAAAMFPYYSQSYVHFDELNEEDQDQPPSFYNKLPAPNSKLPSTYSTPDSEVSDDPEPSAPPVIYPEEEDENVASSSSQQYSQDVVSYANQIFSFNPLFQQPIV